METIMTRVQKALQKEYSSKGILLESAGEGMVGGWIISKSFAGLTGMERQQKVWKLLNRCLDEKDKSRVAVLLTFTPLEKKMAFDDDFDDFRMPAKKKSSSTRRRATTAGRARNGVRNKHRMTGNSHVARKG